MIKLDESTIFANVFAEASNSEFEKIHWDSVKNAYNESLEGDDAKEAPAEGDADANAEEAPADGEQPAEEKLQECGNAEGKCDCEDGECQCGEGECKCEGGECDCQKEKMTEAVFFSNVFSGKSIDMNADIDWKDIKKGFKQSLKESND